MQQHPIYIYSDSYNIELPQSLFPTVKYQAIYQELKKDSFYRRHTFSEPEAITFEQANLVHKKSYLKNLRDLKSCSQLESSELPLTKDIVDAFYLGCGGTLTAARLSLTHGLTMNIGGGFHHAFSDHAEGFCYLNDVAIAIRVLQNEKLISTALIIDLDVHQGNGVAKIFEKDKTVFTFSMHEENNYPVKQKSSLDVALETGCADEEYLALLDKNLSKVKSQCNADIVFYLAGVDSYEHDKLGGLSLTKKGMKIRDQMVFDFCALQPTTIVLAGGYAIDDKDTVALHLQTCHVFSDKE